MMQVLNAIHTESKMQDIFSEYRSDSIGRELKRHRNLCLICLFHKDLFSSQYRLISQIEQLD